MKYLSTKELHALAFLRDASRQLMDSADVFNSEPDLDQVDMAVDYMQRTLDQYRQERNG